MHGSNLIYTTENVRLKVSQAWENGYIGLDTRIHQDDRYQIPNIGPLTGNHIIQTMGNLTINQLFTDIAQRVGRNNRKKKVTNIIRYLAKNQRANQCIPTSTRENTIGGRFISSLPEEQRNNFIDNDDKIMQQVRMVNVNSYTSLLQLLELWNATKNNPNEWLPVPDHVNYEEQTLGALRYCPCIRTQNRCQLPTCRWVGGANDGVCIPNTEPPNNADEITSRAFQPTSSRTDVQQPRPSSTTYAGQYRANNNETIVSSQPPLEYVSSWLKPFFD